MIKMYKDKQGVYKGESMITYGSTEGADNAIKYLNGKTILLILLLLLLVLLSHPQDMNMKETN